MGKRSAIVIATAAFALLGAQSATATTIEVTSTDDSGAGSLRSAINQATDLSGFDRIVIEVTGTIPLQSQLPTLTTRMVIQAPDPSKLSLDGSAVPGAVLALDPVNRCSPSTRCLVTLRGVSIDHASRAIQNDGVLDLIHSSLSDNSDGILNGRKVRVIDSTLSDNSTGIVAFNSANRTNILRSTLVGNRTAISNGDNRLNVTASTLTGNRRYGIDDAFGQAVIARSTLAGSRITVAGGSVNITDSTLRANSDHAVISSSDNSTATLQSTIVANPSTGAACLGPVESVGLNLADDDSCNLVSRGDQPNTDPMLRPLGNYGGPTKTFALPKTSPAIDAGIAVNTPTDQRRLPRHVDYPGVPTAFASDNSDIGAFELQAP